MVAHDSFLLVLPISYVQLPKYLLAYGVRDLLASARALLYFEVLGQRIHQDAAVRIQHARYNIFPETPFQLWCQKPIFERKTQQHSSLSVLLPILSQTSKTKQS